MKFKCWEPGGEDEEDAVEYDTADAEDAAEEHAEKIHPYSDGGANLDIDVRNLEDNTHHQFTVQVDYDPVFTAGARRS